MYPWLAWSPADPNWIVFLYWILDYQYPCFPGKPLTHVVSIWGWEPSLPWPQSSEALALPCARGSFCIIAEVLSRLLSKLKHTGFCIWAGNQRSSFLLWPVIILVHKTGKIFQNSETTHTLSLCLKKACIPRFECVCQKDQCVISQRSVHLSS